MQPMQAPAAGCAGGRAHPLWPHCHLTATSPTLTFPCLFLPTALAGYALTIYIPISFVCIIPNELVRWLVVMGGTATSALFLLMNVRERIMASGAAK